MNWNPLEGIFVDTLNREGQTITCHDKNIRCFFRRNSDEMSIRDSVILYYVWDSPIDPGNIYQYNNNNYLILNKETEECNIYRKSHAVRCNGSLRNLTRPINKLYIYCPNIVHTLAAGGETLSIIDGNTTFQTEVSKESRKLQINDIFCEYGRTWQIQNLYEIDGILHITAQVTADVDLVYSLAFLEPIDDTAYVGDLIDITSVIRVNDTVCPDAYINYSAYGSGVSYSLVDSSNRKHVRVKSVGTLTITVTGSCDGQTFQIRKQVKVTTATVELTATIDGADTPYAGISNTYTATILDGTTDVTSNAAITWSFDGDYYKSTIVQNADNPAIATIKPDTSAQGKTITIKLVATYNGAEITTTKTIKPRGMF